MTERERLERLQADAYRYSMLYGLLREHGCPLTDGCHLPTTVAAWLRALGAARVSDLAAVYGTCPWCGAPGVERERRLGGNDTCLNGHVYPSTEARPPRAEGEGVES